MPTIYPDDPDQPLPADNWPKPPPVKDPQFTDEPDWESPFDQSDEDDPQVRYRGATNDPVFGLVIALALSIGLMPLIPTDAAMRYVLVWGIMAGFAVLSWLIGTSGRIWTETPGNLGWGVIFGLIIAVPFLLVGGTTLSETAERLFPALSDGTALAFLLFVMPLAETLFFRATLQENRRFWIVGLLATVWSMAVFFPMLDIRNYPAVAFLIGTALFVMNMTYSYVRRRNGIAAAWICQLVVNIALLFLPLLG
jgi:hypothetical protein